MAETIRKKHDVWIDYRAMVMEFRVVWNTPKTSAGFEFPRCEIGILTIDPDTQERNSMHKRMTGPHQTVNAMVTELCQLGLHPLCMKFIGRSISLQMMDICETKEFETALGKWRKVKRKLIKPKKKG